MRDDAAQISGRSNGPARPSRSTIAYLAVGWLVAIAGLIKGIHGLMAYHHTLLLSLSIVWLAACILLTTAAKAWPRLQRRQRRAVDGGAILVGFVAVAVSMMFAMLFPQGGELLGEVLGDAFGRDNNPGPDYDYDADIARFKAARMRVGEVVVPISVLTVTMAIVVAAVLEANHVEELPMTAAFLAVIALGMLMLRIALGLLARFNGRRTRT